ENHELRPVAVTTITAGGDDLLRQVLARTDDTGRARPGPRQTVLQTGAHLLIPDIPPTYWDEVSTDEQQRQALRALGVTSLLVVPMRARANVLGVLTLGQSTSRRRFGEDDVAVATDLAARIGLAIDNSRLQQAAEEALS